MNRAEVLALAKTKPKGNYRIYSDLKNLLDEILSCADYDKFISELIKILKV